MSSKEENKGSLASEAWKLDQFGGKMINEIEYVDSNNYIERALAILRTTGNLRLVGETGTGKTMLTYKLAEILKAPLFEDVLTQDTTRWDLLGCDILKEGETKTRDGIVVRWLRSGGIHYGDGFNYARPSILSLYESLGDFRGSVWVPELGKTFYRNTEGKTHYLIISYNPADKSGYSGTFMSNIATIRRFEGLIIDYLPEFDERRLIQKFAGGKNDDKSYDFASKFVELARKTRDMYKRGNLRTPLTTGNLKNYAKLYHEQQLAEEDIIEIASSLYPDNEREQFKRLWEEARDINIEKLKKAVTKTQNKKEVIA